MLALTVVALAVAGADSAMAQDPCQPDCEAVEMDNPGMPLAAPLLVAFAALAALVIARWREEDPESRRVQRCGAAT